MKRQGRNQFRKKTTYITYLNLPFNRKRCEKVARARRWIKMSGELKMLFDKGEKENRERWEIEIDERKWGLEVWQKTARPPLQKGGQTIIEAIVITDRHMCSGFCGNQRTTTTIYLLLRRYIVALSTIATTVMFVFICSSNSPNRHYNQCVVRIWVVVVSKAITIRTVLSVLCSGSCIECH